MNREEELRELGESIQRRYLEWTLFARSGGSGSESAIEFLASRFGLLARIQQTWAGPRSAGSGAPLDWTAFRPAQVRSSGGGGVVVPNRQESAAAALPLQDSTPPATGRRLAGSAEGAEGEIPTQPAIVQSAEAANSRDDRAADGAAPTLRQQPAAIRAIATPPMPLAPASQPERNAQGKARPREAPVPPDLLVSQPSSRDLDTSSPQFITAETLAVLDRLAAIEWTAEAGNSRDDRAPDGPALTLREPELAPSPRPERPEMRGEAQAGRYTEGTPRLRRDSASPDLFVAQAPPRELGAPALPLRAGSEPGAETPVRGNGRRRLADVSELAPPMAQPITQPMTHRETVFAAPQAQSAQAMDVSGAAGNGIHPALAPSGLSRQNDYGNYELSHFLDTAPALNGMARSPLPHVQPTLAVTPGRTTNGAPVAASHETAVSTAGAIETAPVEPVHEHAAAAPAAGEPAANLDEIVERAVQLLTRRLAIEAERRGVTQWR
jgi:hypothetical protein